MIVCICTWCKCENWDSAYMCLCFVEGLIRTCICVEWMRVMVRHSPFPPLAPYQGPVTSETQPTCMIRFPFIVLSPSLLHFLWYSPSPVSSHLSPPLPEYQLKWGGHIFIFSLLSQLFSFSLRYLSLSHFLSCSNDSIENESCCSGVQWNSLYTHSLPEVSFVMELVIAMRQTAL